MRNEEIKGCRRIYAQLGENIKKTPKKLSNQKPKEAFKPETQRSFDKASREIRFFGFNVIHRTTY